MSDTIHTIGNAMGAEADALRVLSQNVANAETVGYRRQIPIAHMRFDTLLNNASEMLLHSSTRSDVAIDFKTGPLKNTGEPLNIALDGPGFLVLDTPQGQLLTRRGDLHIDVDGTLVSSSGHRVLGEKGAIQIGSAVPAISTDGVVNISSNPIDQLRIVNIVDRSSVVPLGDGTYHVDMVATEEGQRPAVRQGYLEGSNVVPVNEMLQLMEIVRRFETEQKFALAYSGMIEKAISEIGKI